MKIKLSDYDFRVFWSSEDNEFVAKCDALPSVSYLHVNPVDALQGLIELIEELDDDD